MQLTKEYIDQVRKVASEYDSEKDPQRRKAIGEKLDEVTSPLSDGQLLQMSKILSH